ncbi:glycosyltransferase family 2 protein [Pectobacterium brasiliense]|uniref:glycosyltransferase family 2 protein n=1 Tax=Pectobacterium brasiliense TaxID=180957 RepID=UPI002A81478F|nr:glycosyltransferase family 2 protein [Pectobacterium brasiliense]MDY4368062.1 glycosyltransferase family 2 protein [Pectobacterium brasiliense]MDY7057594.1 glycosyltransferase family 2 protein [Pectobacterium brasiliense]
MDITPKITVITVVYNNSSELQETIDSISSQTYSNIEYVVVDGGSKDGTLDIIKKNTKFIDKWISEADKGIYDAMNKGVHLATGDFVIFMNSGDKFYSADVIFKVIQESNGLADVIYGDHWTVSSRANDGPHRAKDVKNLKFGMVCSHQSMFFRRKLLMDRGFSNSYGTAADYELTCYLFSKKTKFHKLEKVIISYYRAGGISDKKRIKSLYYSYKAFSDNLKCNFVVNAFYLWRFTLEFIKAIFIRGKI